MPLTTKIGAQARYITDRQDICLSEDQAKYMLQLATITSTEWEIYIIMYKLNIFAKKVKTANIVNVDTIKQGIEID